MKKKFFAALLFVCLMATAWAGPAEDLLAKAEKTEAGLVAMAESLPVTQPESGKGRATLNPVAYEALLLAFADVPFKDDLAPDYKAPACLAFKALQKKYNFPALGELFPVLLKHPAPGVRAKVVEIKGGGLLGADQKTLQAIQNLLANETDPGVLYALIGGFANEGGKNAEVGKFLVKCLDNEHPKVRRWVVLKATSSWNTNTPDLTEKMAAMMESEQDEEVKLAVVQYAGKLGNDQILVPAYAKFLKSTQNQKQLAKAIEGLLQLWWSFPLYQYTSEAAYRLTLDFWNGFRPEKLETPAWTMFSPLNKVASASSKQFPVWKEKATWYKPEDVRAAIKPFFTNLAAPSPMRDAVRKALIVHGATKAELTALVDELEAAGDKKFYLDSFRKEISKMAD